VAPRTGAWRRASRQMKYEMPASTTIAPTAIAIAPVPLSPLFEPPVVAVGTATAGVVAVGVAIVGWGMPGANGLVDPGRAGTTGVVAAVTVLPAASAPAGRNPSRTARTSATSLLTSTRRYRSEASGCSIAGVDGGLRYGSSFS
jgi:hypothetical protein